MRPIDALDETVSEFSSYIACLAPFELDLSASEEWGAREVLIHIVYWHEQYASITHDLLRCEKPRLLAGTYKQHNARAVELNRLVPVGALLERLAKAQAGLLAAYDAVSDKSFAYKQGSQQRPYPQAVAEIDAHIRGHLNRLRARYH